MSNNNNKQPLDLTDSLPVAPESQLKAIRGQDSDVLQNLKPGVTKRVEVLRGIQSEHDELESKVFEERAALEARYLKLSAPLYSKRYDIVTGTVEVDGAMEEDAMDQTDDTEKGVPEFWLTAMKHNNEFCPYYSRYTISERDEEALKYLKDIKWCHMDDPKGFKLEFFFDTNPFFTNSVVTKVYHMTSSYYFDKLILVKTIGTTIEWLPEKCLTQKIFQMKPKKGSKNAQPITKTEDCESFFNFFSPLEVPANEEEIEEDMANKLQDQIEQDYNIGLIIRDKIIPHAVSCFMGEAKQEDFGEETKAKKKSQLKAIGGQDSDVLKNLKPAVRKRVEVLRGIQSEHDELESKIFEERAALEARYQKLSAPLYSKRYDIVTGVVEIDGAKDEDAMDQTDDTEKGVPEFWLTAMKHNVITAKEITVIDEEALKYLKDIKWHCMDDTKSFKLEFYFDTNPFFKNSVLTKVYNMTSSCSFYYDIVEKAIGTTIKWLPRKCLTHKIFKKKNEPLGLRRRRFESFFNFFDPEFCTVDCERQDYNIGLTIRDKIIPHAVSCFTGETNQGVLQGFAYVDDEYDEDEIEEDEDNEDEIEVDDEDGEDDEDDEDGEDDEVHNEDIEEDDDKDDECNEDEEETKTKKKRQLKAIGGQDSDLLENLKPAVRKRVEVLRGIQSEHDELEAKFFEEKAKYHKLYAPLYSKRYDIVTGAVEVDGAKEEDAMDDDTEKGVPEFWLTAMKHNKFLAIEISKQDKEVLKYLKDIKWCRMDDPKGFKLEFFFDTNPFFTNSVLTKVYHMTSSRDFNKLMFEKAIGTTIEWLPDKCLTNRYFRKKNETSFSKKESFFKFFCPEELHLWLSERRHYYTVGLAMRKIIPHAVSWFTGEANTEDIEGFDNENDEDGKDDDDDDEIEEYTYKELFPVQELPSDGDIDSGIDSDDFDLGFTGEANTEDIGGSDNEDDEDGKDDDDEIEVYTDKELFPVQEHPSDSDGDIENNIDSDNFDFGILINVRIIPHSVSWFNQEDDEETKTKKKSQLNVIGGQDSGVLENLKPAVKKRVEVLRGIQSEHDLLEAKFFEEKAKYQKLYAQLYSKRYDIVTGAVEVDGAKEEDSMDRTDDIEKGVPEFWLTAMKHNVFCLHHLRTPITKRDEEVLKYLKDIKWCRMDDPKGFKLEFFFDTNPFFRNSILTKVYHMRSSCYFDKLIMENAIGTTIEWLPGKCLTQKILKLKPKVSATFLANQRITKTLVCESFFKFFSPPKEEIKLMREDYNIGLTIRDKIIPHAVSWFTGEANQEDFGVFDEEDDEDYEDADDFLHKADYRMRRVTRRLNIPKIKTVVAPRNPSQSAEASITDVNPGKKNDSLDIPASSENDK